MTAAVYARVSTDKQLTDLQLAELRDYCERRGWQATEYVDQGVSGAKDRRPALDQLMADARRRRFSVVIVWKLDRLGRSLPHLVACVEEFRTLEIDFICLTQDINTQTPNGRLIFHIFAAVAEFERSLIAERIRAGMKAAKERLKRGPYRRMRDGQEHVVRRIGRPPADVSHEQIRVELARASGNKTAAAQALGIGLTTLREKLKGAKSNDLALPKVLYRKSEPGLWTVGFYTPEGKWEPESDHNSEDAAAARVHYLNGGTPEPEPKKKRYVTDQEPRG